MSFVLSLCIWFVLYCIGVKLCIAQALLQLNWFDKVNSILPEIVQCYVYSSGAQSHKINLLYGCCPWMWWVCLCVSDDLKCVLLTVKAIPTVAENDAVLNSFVWYLTMNDVFPTPLSPSKMTCNTKTRIGSQWNSIFCSTSNDEPIQQLEFHSFNYKTSASENEAPIFRYQKYMSIVYKLFKTNGIKWLSLLHEIEMFRT